ncbi:RnfABCDGE type electron transport complex subunit B [Enterococcus larvae]|uniref:RnfABCDGE type electron transport complex subunit B n=1 Tax=Enterococcus larvae TaxID=2794352 RepID=UPI003F3A1DF9
MIESIVAPILIVSGLGLFAGIGLSIATIIFDKPADKKEEALKEVLPGINCGACGFTGCEGYAQAMAANEAEANLCTPGGIDVQTQLAELLGTAIGDYRRTAAFVHCNGTCNHTKEKMDYAGAETCYGAAQIFGGPGSCQFGCMGYGDCEAVCAYDAIHIKNGVAVVDEERCIGCLECITACPKQLIRMLPAAEISAVVCSNHERGGGVKKLCEVGCIACSKCVRSCPVQAITMEDSLAVIDPELCTNCGSCIEVCPQNCIVEVGSSVKVG